VCQTDADCAGECANLGDAGAVCALPCATNADCPINAACFTLPTADGGTQNLCLNEDAGADGVCAAGWVCEQGTPGGDAAVDSDAGVTPQPTDDAGGGVEGPDTGDNTGDATPIEFFGGSSTGCSSVPQGPGAPAPSPWMLVGVALVLGGIRRR
jgi:MYXO-CTERM domain-containing protein